MLPVFSDRTCTFCHFSRGKNPDCRTFYMQAAGWIASGVVIVRGCRSLSLIALKNSMQLPATPREGTRFSF
jgi:hypothetical protein